jgi:hypothetical protein
LGRVVDGSLRDVLEERQLLGESLAREPLGVVEDDRRVVPAPHRQRLRRVDVDDEIRSAAGAHSIGEPADPAVLIPLIGRAGVPVGHRREVRKGRIVIAAAVDHGEAAILI